MEDKVLFENYALLEKRSDKYKSNWGSLLEFVDMTKVHNISNVIISALRESSKKKPTECHVKKSGLNI